MQANEIINPKIYKQITLYLRKNLIDSFDTIWGTLGNAHKWIFFDISRLSTQPWLKRPQANKLLSFEITIETS